MKKGLIVLVALFITVVAVAAQVAAQDTAAPALSGVVRVGSWESGTALAPWEKAIASFKAANPGVDVQLEAVPQDYGTKLLAQFASGTAPDVFMVGDGDVAKFQSMGVAESLDSYIDGPNGFKRDDLLSAVAAFGKVGDGTYYLTKDYSPLVLFYNKKLFSDAGVATPTADWTWDDLLNTAMKLTVDANGKNATEEGFDGANVQRWGIQLPDGWGATDWTRGILPIIYQNGGSLIAPDGSKADGFMNSEATVAALQWYVDLIKTHHVAPSKTDAAAFSGVDLFQTGSVAMLWTGVWPMASYKEDTTLSFGTSGLPKGPVAKGNVLCWSGFALNAGSQNKDAAWAFMKYVAVGDGAKEFANYAWTDVKSIIESQGLATDEYAGPIVADLPNALPIPDQTTASWGECGDHFFVQEINTVLEGDVSVKDAMDKAVSEADACLTEKAAAMAEATPAS